MARHPAGYSLLTFSCTTGSDRPLPKPQRQGEILTFGMLALAWRSICYGALLRVGPEPLGKVRELAVYFFGGFVHRTDVVS